MPSKAPFYLNIPVTLGDIKLDFHINELLRVTGYDCVSAPHSHGDWEIRYIASGYPNVIIDGVEYTLSQGDVVLIQPTQSHYQTEERIAPSLVQYSIRMEIRNPLDAASGALDESLRNELTIKDEKSVLAPLFNRLWREIIDRRPGFFNYLQALCQSIIIEIIRLREMDVDSIFTTDTAKYTSYWYDRLEKYLHSHFMEDVKLEDLAENMNLSPRHASRVVMKEYGTSFISKLTEIRLANAKYMLRHSKKSLTAIASSCGFSSYSYFTTCFKRNLGLTPCEYRKKYKK